MKTRLSGFALCFAVTVFFFGLVGCAESSDAIDESVSPEPVLMEESNVFASAEFAPALQAQLSFPNGAQQIQVLVQPGQMVEAGELLVTSETSQLEALVAQAQAGVDRTEYALAALKAIPDTQSLTAAEAALKNAEVNYDRLDRANAREIEMDAAEMQVSAAQAALDALQTGPSEEQLTSAESDLVSARAQLAAQELALENASLRAPFRGTVVEVYLRDFENANPNQPVVLLADGTQMQLVTTDLSETDVVHLAVGDRAVISVDALPDVKLEGEVVGIARKSQPGSGVYFQVTVAAADIPESIAWGMSAFIEFLPD